MKAISFQVRARTLFAAGAAVSTLIGYVIGTIVQNTVPLVTP